MEARDLDQVAEWAAELSGKDWHVLTPDRKKLHAELDRVLVELGVVTEGVELAGQAVASGDTPAGDIAPDPPGAVTTKKRKAKK